MTKTTTSHSNSSVGFWPRAVAQLVDMALLSLATSFLLFRVAQTTSIPELIVTALNTVAWVVLPAALASVLYYAIGLSKFGATLGKACVGLHVTDMQGNFLTWHRALFREYLAKTVCWALMGLGFISVAKDPNHRGWHDHLADTHVRHASMESGVRTWLGVVVLVLLCSIHAWLWWIGIQALLANTGLWLELGRVSL